MLEHQAMSKKLTQKQSNNKVRWLLIALFVVFIGLLLWGINWATYARPPLPEAVAALESDERVKVTEDPWLTFAPSQTTPETGFIFYPGGRIDPKGYASLMQNIAAERYLVVVPEMPINMAVFDANVADEIIAAHPEIDHWAIGGHSVGGTMAAQYTNTHRDMIGGLAIWASFPADNANLSDSDILVILIYGTEDSRVHDNSVKARKHLLPDDTSYIRIEGGDHHQFGDYEIKPEEHHAVIERAEQQEIIIQSTLSLLNAISETE